MHDTRPVISLCIYVLVVFPARLDLDTSSTMKEFDTNTVLDCHCSYIGRSSTAASSRESDRITVSVGRATFTCQAENLQS